MQHQQIPNLVSSILPMNQNNSPIVGASEFNLSDHKHPLSSPHDLMSVPVKPFNSNIFTRSLSSSTSSPSLQLSSNNSLNNILEENGSLHLSAAATSPHMSATALLQKAAQMGATVSSNSNAGMVMTDKTTVATNMMTPPPLFGMVQQQGHSFMSHYMQQQQQQPQYINNNFNGNVMLSGGGVNGSMNGVDMFNAILDQSKALSKIIEQNNQTQSMNNVGGGGGASSNIMNIGGSKGSGGDVMTLDLLGIGGGGAHGNFYGGGGAQQQQQQAESAAAAVAADEVWRNWSTKNGGFETFSATSNI